METTRHITATVYIVNDGATALHHHDRLGIRVAPGGHVDRDELPHEAGIREVREETGLDATLVADVADVDAPDGEPLPQPAHMMLYDINVHEDGRVGHQHIDHVYFARVEARDIDPDGDDEEGPEAWDWYTREDLQTSDVDPDTVQIGIEAIETVGQRFD
ncbi:ADP-ribose pyrophosphatase YjhB, NUDIX family [Halogranum gelatinilyticum]|uniref:ADP-ribose pyrophosphatase YjhB, NUDIX family n=1 Tax=Halogranum gelatinilyticum TaxID=660521 RepID=A0A1G9QZ84_9EURY|nr:NUDIX domain-containing protein [Halogranum gelatinilyticum]SDM16352.1 ADP-ribose pyrophosphatase YjhB, NUDIX family [Halogranum gelatinilyticum]